VYSCPHWLRPRNPLPRIWAQYEGAIGQPIKRHLFVNPGQNGCCVLCRLGEAAETRDLLGRQLIQMETLQVNIIIIVIIIIMNLYCHKSNLISIRIDYIVGTIYFFLPALLVERMIWPCPFYSGSFDSRILAVTLRERKIKPIEDFSSIAER
jgi:hypothetical protein